MKKLEFSVIVAKSIALFLKSIMIEIDPSFLSQQALDNLMTEIIIRQNCEEISQISLATKKILLLKKLKRGEVIIIYHAKDGFCDIVKTGEN